MYFRHWGHVAVAAYSLTVLNQISQWPVLGYYHTTEEGNTF